MHDDILYTVKDAVAWITINQAEKMNRLTFDGIVRLVANVRRADEDDQVKVLVVTGAGDKAFCAGASIDQIEQDSVLTGKKNLDAYAQLMRVFYAIHKPSIAMINGYALAGGCGLAMLPTFGIASERAVFGCPEINVGFWSMMVMAVLFRTVGRKKGLELICTGESIDAREAQRIGMINKAVPHEELKDHVEDLVDKLKSKSRSALKFGLEAYYNTIDMEYNKAVSYLRDMAVILSNTPDCIEGTRAFMEKRKPNPNSQE